ncbi:hypothetical protein [Halovulum sp. GXIMD14793]
MTNVTSLQRQEQARLDARAIEILENSLGPIRCREVIEEACFDMVDKLGAVEVALHRSDRAEAGRLARKIAVLADQIGLEDFARVARDLNDCLQTDHLCSQHAVARRLMHVGEVSLMSMMQLTEDPYA